MIKASHTYYSLNASLSDIKVKEQSIENMMKYVSVPA